MTSMLSNKGLGIISTKVVVQKKLICNTMQVLEMGVRTFSVDVVEHLQHLPKVDNVTMDTWLNNK